MAGKTFQEKPPIFGNGQAAVVTEMRLEIPFVLD